MRRYSGMSRDAEVIVLARWSDEVMAPLTQDDPERAWRGRFVPIAGHGGYEFGWALEFEKVRARKGLLGHLESLPWPHPHSLQFLLRDRLVEVAIPRTERFHQPAPPDEEFEPDPGVLLRTDQNTALPEQTPEACRDSRSPW